MSDHLDGVRYYNPEATGSRGLGLILRWMITRQKARWPRRIENLGWLPPSDPVPAGVASLTFIGHSTFPIRLAARNGAQLTVLTDPVFSERCSPVQHESCGSGAGRARPKAVCVQVWTQTALASSVK